MLKPGTAELVMDVVRKHFRPEFLNRLDDCVIFHPLTREQISQIVKIQTKLLADRKCPLLLLLALNMTVQGWWTKTSTLNSRTMLLV